MKTFSIKKDFRKNPLEKHLIKGAIISLIYIFSHLFRFENQNAQRYYTEIKATVIRLKENEYFQIFAYVAKLIALLWAESLKIQSARRKVD